jgi:hypothetical protein
MMSPSPQWYPRGLGGKRRLVMERAGPGRRPRAGRYSKMRYGASTSSRATILLTTDEA